MCIRDRTYHGRYVVPQYIQLEQVLIYLMVVEMRRDDIALHIVSRVLHRAELIYLMVVRHYDYASRMLSRRTLDSGASLRQTIRLELVYRTIELLRKLHHVSVCRLVLYSTYGTGLEHVFFSEDLTYVLRCV